ncbi:MAG: polysaccharide pyruvyl transferase family protein [Bdellovibrionales bacterium]|nr:polysaccharide pyruvyl transferase family protein [Bdellovibrionales bacterium]
MIESLSPDVTLQSWMSLMIDMTHKKGKIKQHRWQPGLPLKLLFVGYTGSRNTGADVRVSEMIRQIEHVLGKNQSQLSIVSVDLKGSKDYFPDVTQIHIPKIFPMFLYKHCPQYDGVIACEGSMFKSKFADALSTLMAGALGMANAENKLSIGYGAEAGQMTPHLQSFVEKQCHESLIICRNKASQAVLDQLHIRNSPGTDTAWTFAPPAKEIGEKILKAHGWDGKKPIVAICPIDPFCWPVRPSISKTFKKYILGQHQDEHYDSIYFHEINEKKKQQFEKYILSIHNALKRFEEEHQIFPILIGMEKLDRKACNAINKKRTHPIPMFISDEYNIFEMLSILHHASSLISSRFHAIVCSMTGLVPSAGITMDERIHNLLTDRDDTTLLLKVDQDDLEQRTYECLVSLHQNKEEIVHRIGKMIPREIQKMGEMGKIFSQEVQKVYPDFCPSIAEGSWEKYLPSLHKQTQHIMEQFG